MADRDLRDPSLYTPLNLARQEIRLLKILPGSEKSNIYCKLKTHSLQDHTPRYQQFLININQDDNISQQWMQERLSPVIILTDSLKRIHGQQPTSTLHRYSWGDFATLSNGEFGGDFLLWVDTLCINQTDLEEREAQVQRMRQIYQMAWTVVAWLGEGTCRIDAAVQLLRDFASFKEAACLEYVVDELKENPSFLGRGCWLGLQELMDRTYWQRLWIVQEIVMGANSAWLRVGNALIDWPTFCKDIRTLREHFWEVKDVELRLDQEMAGIKRSRAWQTISLHLVYEDLSVISGCSDAETSTKELKLLQLLEIAASTSCTDARDKVYALIGLMPSKVAQALEPDYTLPLSKVFARTARTFVEVGGSLDALREGNPWGQAGSPSWAADWLWLGRAGVNKANSRRMLSYRASGDRGGEPSFSEDGLLLQCTGFVVDRITGLSACGNGYFEWDAESVIAPEHYRSIYGSYECTREALFRTLLADRGTDNHKATATHAAILNLPSAFSLGKPLFEQREWKNLLSKDGYYYRWEGFRGAPCEFTMGDLIFNHFFSDDLPQDAEEHNFTEVWNCFDRASKRRRFMTTEKGYIGWAPDNILGESNQQTEKDDLIAIIFGCSTPIVIRPCGYQFQVLGEAYVQGLMDGEMVEEFDQGKYESRTFTFH